jgi:Kef-type K+ transport system membrane component KefB
VLGYLLGGALVGPYALGIIQDVESIKHLAELGVVFLLFNIGLELSMERLASMAKMVFGMGTLQVCEKGEPLFSFLLHTLLAVL